MPDREKVIEGLEMSFRYSNVDESNTLVPQQLVLDTIALLKAHEQATIEPKRIDLADETKAWLDKMDAVDALENITSICVDWDGYRTANGLGGLINEIWAYARYCADRLLKAQEPVEPTIGGDADGPCKTWWYQCGKCKEAIDHHDKYCRNCGRAVKWE